MKFQVATNMFGEVEVKLHQDTKKKINKIAFRTLVVAGAISYITVYRLNNDMYPFHK